MQQHVVYLANTSGLKIGITRKSQLPVRWIDQGAVQALPVYLTKDRHVAGLIEAALSRSLDDKTNWRQMLQGAPVPLDLVAIRSGLWEQERDLLATISHLFEETGAFVRAEDPATVEFSYPVAYESIQLKSISFDKQPIVEGFLRGIKGQYLILDDGVLNVRKHTGYHVEVAL